MSAARVLRSLLGWSLSVLMFLGSGEAALRVIYRDGGRTTLGGPGPNNFEHLFITNDQRGRFDAGPRRPGVPRILVIGDSITWGQGVRDWHDVWTEQLAQALERKHGQYEMAVLARPGRNIGEHFGALEQWGARIQPDVLIYQWYVNDIEVLEHRPANLRRWRQWPTHNALRRSSYLYHFLDNQLGQLLPTADRSYVQYILEDFAPGRLEWAEFERLFHNFATRARDIAARRLLVLYPQVPIRGDVYPLQPVHDRMRTLAAPHRLSIPPIDWVRLAGSMEPRRDAPWHQALRVPAGFSGPVAETRDYAVSGNALEVGVRVIWEAAGGNATVDVELVDHVTNQVIARGSAPVAAQSGAWQELKTTLDTRAAQGHHVRIRLVAPAAAPLAFGSIDLPVDYGFSVVDLTDALKTFNTHASMFDAHPNERAHAVIAREVLTELARP